MAEDATRVTANLTETHHTHDLSVDPSSGLYDGDQDGRLTRFTFGKGDNSHAAPIALARLMPFSAG